MAHLLARTGELLLRGEVTRLLLELLGVRKARGLLVGERAAAVALGEPRHERAREPRHYHVLLAGRRQHPLRLELHALSRCVSELLGWSP